jgi:hypothetical protein
MRDYGGIQERSREESDKESDEESEPTFATPPPPPWHEFNTPITNTGRRKGVDYIKLRMLAGTITPTVIRVQEKVEKAADRMILRGQLSTELLAANKAKEEERSQRNDAPNKIVQKYGEIYSHQARRQIAIDKEDEQRVINMRNKRITDLAKKRYKALIKGFPKQYRQLRLRGEFIWAGTFIELGLEF